MQGLQNYEQCTLMQPTFRKEKRQIDIEDAGHRHV